MMNTSSLEKSPIKDLYFARMEKWDWLNKEMIHVFDSKSPRIITMDPWPQILYLDAIGNITVSDYIHQFASKYPKTQVPNELAETILNELLVLVNTEKIVKLNETPIVLEDSLMQPMTQEGEINLFGRWKGTYTYNLPHDHKEPTLMAVEFTIKIAELKGTSFTGTVEDDPEGVGTPGVGKITGTFNEEGIQFDKMMPVHCYLDDNGNRVIDTKKMHPTISYIGVFSRNKQHITGTWQFKKKRLFWKGFIPFWYSLGSGNFTMRKD